MGNPYTRHGLVAEKGEDKFGSFRELSEHLKKLYWESQNEKPERFVASFSPKETGKKIWKKIFGGGVVANETNEAIAVAGEDMNGKRTVIYIYPGESTKGKLEDADAVVILPGQRFRIPGGISETAGKGAIKVKPLVPPFVFTVTKGAAGFSVSGMGAAYVDEGFARDQGWVPPP